MPYIGAPLVSTNFVLDQFTATSGQTAFTLSRAPASAQSVIVMIDGAIQEPGQAYTVSGVTLTTTAGVGLNNRVAVIHLGVQGVLTTPADGTVGFVKLDSTLNGSVVQSTYAEYTTNADITTTIPVDDTIPQITEGVEVMNIAFVPRSASSKIRIRFSCFGGMSGASAYLSGAFFKDATANALAAQGVFVETATAFGVLSMEYEESAGSTSSRTYRVRVGPSAGTLRLNGSSSGRIFGGVGRATLVVEEIKA